MRRRVSFFETAQAHLRRGCLGQAALHCERRVAQRRRWPLNGLNLRRVIRASGLPIVISVTFAADIV
jgi:hypothetical protein